ERSSVPAESSRPSRRRARRTAAGPTRSRRRPPRLSAPPASSVTLAWSAPALPTIEPGHVDIRRVAPLGERRRPDRRVPRKARIVCLVWWILFTAHGGHPAECRTPVQDIIYRKPAHPAVGDADRHGDRGPEGGILNGGGADRHGGPGDLRVAQQRVD